MPSVTFITTEAVKGKRRLTRINVAADLTHEELIASLSLVLRRQISHLEDGKGKRITLDDFRYADEVQGFVYAVVK